MPVPVININQMREWESLTWTSGQTEAEVIRQVGWKVAFHAGRLTRAGDFILILAGKGNNGNDARAAMEFLPDRRVELLNVTTPETDVRRFWELAEQQPALVIDGLFGIGLNRPLDEAWQNLIIAVNASKLPILAIDTPSGLNAETGQVMGAAIEAAITLTVGAPKTGMLAQEAWPFVGRLETLEDIGLVPCPFTGDVQWTINHDFNGFPPRRPVAGHKGSFGHLAIIAGSQGFHGASVLAALGAQRAQPGLITVFPQEEVYPVVASQLRSPMVSIWKPDIKYADTTSTVLIGPGLAAPRSPDDLRIATRRLWRDARFPVVVDASALDWLAQHPLAAESIRVVTPHPGEAARMLNSNTKNIQANRLVAVREISRRYGNCWVVLKGHQTVIGRSSGEIFINSSGNPHLAQGGSGDLLSGYIAGLLAQPSLQIDPGKTIRYAVWQHGATADKLQQTRPNWTVEDLARELGDAR